MTKRDCDLSGVMRGRDVNWNIVSIVDILMHKHEASFFCNKCEYPISAVPDHKRHSLPREDKGIDKYLRHLPLGEIKRTPRDKKSNREEALDLLVKLFSENQAFTTVEREVDYLYHLKDKSKNDYSKPIPIDLFLEKPGMQTVIHVLELEGGSNTPLNQIIAQLQQEPSPSRKERWIKDSKGVYVPLNKKIYQNLFIIKDDYSFRPSGANHLEFVDTISNYISEFMLSNGIPTVNFLDLPDMAIDSYTILSKKEIESEHPNQGHKCKVARTRHHFFNLQPEQSYRANGHANWKRANLVEMPYDFLKKPIIHATDRNLFE